MLLPFMLNHRRNVNLRRYLGKQRANELLMIFEMNKKQNTTVRPGCADFAGISSWLSASLLGYPEVRLLSSAYVVSVHSAYYRCYFGEVI